MGFIGSAGRMPRDYVPPLSAPVPAPRPLIVRLRNWVGDTTLSVPTLQRLQDAGYALQLVGKGWARDLLAGHGWPVHTQPKTLRDRVALLRPLRYTIEASSRFWRMKRLLR